MRKAQFNYLMINFMTEKLPGRKSIIEAVRSSAQTELDRSIRNVTEESRRVRERIAQLQSEKYSLEVQLSELDRTAEGSHSRRQLLKETLEKNKAAWLRVGAMRDYGHAIESGDAEQIDAAIRGIHEQVDVELAMPKCEVIVTLNKPSYRGGPDFGGMEYPTKLASKLNDDERGFIFQRAEHILKLWAEGKIGYVQTHRLEEYREPKKDCYGRASADNNTLLRWVQNIPAPSGLVMQLSQYTPPLADRMEMEGSRDRDKFTTVGMLPTPNVVEQVMSEIIRGLPPKWEHLHGRHPEWPCHGDRLGELVSTTGENVVLDATFSSERIIPGRTLFEQYGVKFFTNSDIVDSKVAQEWHSFRSWPY